MQIHTNVRQKLKILIFVVLATFGFRLYADPGGSQFSEIPDSGKLIEQYYNFIGDVIKLDAATAQSEVDSILREHFYKPEVKIEFGLDAKYLYAVSMYNIYDFKELYNKLEGHYCLVVYGIPKDGKVPTVFSFVYKEVNKDLLIFKTGLVSPQLKPLLRFKFPERFDMCKVGDWYKSLYENVN